MDALDLQETVQTSETCFIFGAAFSAIVRQIHRLPKLLMLKSTIPCPLEATLEATTSTCGSLSHSWRVDRDRM